MTLCPRALQYSVIFLILPGDSMIRSNESVIVMKGIKDSGAQCSMSLGCPAQTSKLLEQTPTRQAQALSRNL